MTKFQELRQLILSRTQDLQGIQVKLTEEKRTHYTDEEKARVAELRSEIESLEQRADDAKFLEERQANEAEGANAAIIAGGNPTSNSERRELEKVGRSFSFARGLGALIKGQPLDGAEAEMTQEARSEAAAFGESINGVAIPAALMTRAATAGTATNAGNTIETTLSSELIESFRPNPSIIGLGARRMEGLTGNVEMARVTDNLVSKWKGETATADETDAGFDKIELRPHRLTAYTQASKQLLIQGKTPASYENFLREDLRTADELAIDLAAINGSGATDVPRGVLNTNGITTLGIGANGGAITRDILVDAVKALATKNVPIENLAWLYDPAVMAELMKTKLDAGSGRFLLESMMDTLLGFRTSVSTQVPNDLAKGTGTDLSAVIFGSWREVILGQWGGRDVTIDPYTKAKDGMIVIVTNSFHDVVVRRPSAFVAIKDVVTA